MALIIKKTSAAKTQAVPVSDATALGTCQPSRAELTAIFDRDAFLDHLGVDLTYHAPGQIELRRKVYPHLRDHLGHIHAGVVASVGGAACFWAATSQVGNVALSQHTMKRIAPAIGDELVAEADVLDVTPSLVVVRTDLFVVRSEDRQIVATVLDTLDRV
ncbi:PaaI family thioesterase [Methylobacterium sp. Gmos1]